MQIHVKKIPFFLWMVSERSIFHIYFAFLYITPIPMTIYSQNKVAFPRKNNKTGKSVNNELLINIFGAELDFFLCKRRNCVIKNNLYIWISVFYSCSCFVFFVYQYVTLFFKKVHFLFLKVSSMSLWLKFLFSAGVIF